MIYIEKKGLPDSVNKQIISIRRSSEWKKIDSDDTTGIRAVFDNQFPKEEVKAVLVHEQKGLCAYCMRRIRSDTHSRIEHFVPLSKDKEQAIAYHNLLASCDGGEKVAGQQGRILCCDAHKKEHTIRISPLNKVQMDKIAYKPDGTIYTKPYDKDMEEDMNHILLLNGLVKEDGSRLDTATEICKGRRDAYERARRMMDSLERKGRCTSAAVKKIIDVLCGTEEREEYVGVKLYYFQKKYNALVRRGL